MQEFQEQVTFWSTRSAVAERALSDAQARRVEREQAAAHLQARQADLGSRLAEIDQLLAGLETERENLRGQTAGMNTQLEELRRLIEPAEKELETAETQEVELQKEETDGQAHWRSDWRDGRVQAAAVVGRIAEDRPAWGSDSSGLHTGQIPVAFCGIKGGCRAERAHEPPEIPLLCLRGASKESGQRAMG